MTTVTSRDVQEIVSMLSSDKAKARDEGIKLLNTWLEGERSVGFCRYIARATAKLKHDELPHSETWPFLITLLIQCSSLEISKRRMPKLIFAKTLRVVVQKAEDAKISGSGLPLLHAAKLLFSHVWDVLKDVPSFQSEYGTILRHLLAARHYKFHMRKRIYCGLVLLYMERVKTSLGGKNSGQSNPKEEVFRCILTLHSLLENPPGDFPDDLRQDIVKGFVGIFYNVREEGKISRKLLECINTYLLKDGPNLGCQSCEIHEAVQQFVFRCWTTTHDRSLKDALVLYARLQLNLTRSLADGRVLLEQLLDVVSKELDQINTCSTSAPWTDINREDRCGTLTNTQYGLVELASFVLCRASVNTSKVPLTEKRTRKEHVAVRLKEGLMNGKWLWNAAFCCLIRNYHTRVSMDLFISCFEAIYANFERIINHANMEHAYDGLIWTLRSLQELSALMLFPVSRGNTSSNSCFTENEWEKGWHTICSCLMRGLPLLCNVTTVVDTSLMLLSSIFSSDLMNSYTVSQDIWELRLFKSSPSMSVLSFISSYFSRKGSQGDLRDILHLRKNLLRAVLTSFNLKECLMLNEQNVVLLPPAVYALCSGCAPIPQCDKGLSAPHTLNFSEAALVPSKVEDEHVNPHEFFECSVEILAEIDHNSSTQVSQTLGSYRAVRLPRQLRGPLLSELETHVIEALGDKDVGKMLLSDIVFKCALLANFMYCSYVTRIKQEVFPFLTKMGQCMLELLDHAVTIVEKTHVDIGCSGLGSDSIFDGMDSILRSFKVFSSLISKCRNKNVMDDVMSSAIMQSIERLLKALVKLYGVCSDFIKNDQAQIALPLTSVSDIPHQDSYPLNSRGSMIMDMELDATDDSKDVDMPGRKIAAGIAVYAVNGKMGIISLISSFFNVLPFLTWDILFNLLKKESDTAVLEHLFCSLCEHPQWSSSGKFQDLIVSITDFVDMHADLKVQFLKVLASVGSLLQNLVLLDVVTKDNNTVPLRERVTKDNNTIPLRERVSEQSLISLGNLVEKVAEIDLLDWFARAKLIDCMCKFVLLKPHVGQTMIEKLLMMLRDPDYRVRFFLARQIGVLFQIWDGHDELFHDICSNFGGKLVVWSRENIVTAKEVLEAGPLARTTMETIIISLMHIVLHSERVELEAVFMICVVAAIDPCQRELVRAVLDNLSKQLQYNTRAEYMEELMGSILFCWVSCGVSLVALVEARDIFALNREPTVFIQHYCHWLLPAVILHGDSPNLKWVATVICQDLSVLVRSHFVQIFSVCIALHCSKKTGGEKGADVLQSSLLSITDMSVNERDKLIKKHMVSIVNYILSLASSSSDPVLPYFSKDNVARAIQTVVDGFLEMEDLTGSCGVLDKINVFRPDRVFMFIVELHYKVTAAVNYRHKCNRLAGIEVLLNVLGNRAAVPSTFNYLFNLVGQFIGSLALQNQCCHIIITLLKIVSDNPSKETICVLGEQIQYLVSKLVQCCFPSESNRERPVNGTYQVLSLLHQLIVDSPPSLHDYIKELEPFPELDVFDLIRKFHVNLCQEYSPRDHLLKFVRRSCYLPPRLLFCSLKALHKKLFKEEFCKGEKSAADISLKAFWDSDNEIAHAVWTLLHMCKLDDTNSFGALVSDFISRVGIGDPHGVVFHLYGDSSRIRVCRDRAAESRFLYNTGIPEDLLISLMRLMKKYLMDDSVKIIDMTSQAIRGILSTERGQQALVSFDAHERSLIEVHSKGVNSEVVQNFLLDLEGKSKAEATSLENSALWRTHDKTFEMWICPLVYALIGCCDDTILRLCQDIALVKAEVAELLLPNVFVNLAGRKAFDFDLCKLICVQMKDNIFIESNKLNKSIQIILDALNELRLCHVMERAASSSNILKRESPKPAKPSSYGSRLRSTSAKVKESTTSSTDSGTLTLCWDKVYWLPIDYLIVAASAINCGSFFTAVLYVEHWCKEYFNCLTLGSPDFSHLEVLPRHIEILISAVTQINEPDSLYGIIQSHKLTSQIVTLEHEGNWSKALEYYDLQVRSEPGIQAGDCWENVSPENSQRTVNASIYDPEKEVWQKKPYKGLIRSLQQIGCTHMLDVYCQGLTSRKGRFQHDLEFSELQYEAAWRAGNWDFSLLYDGADSSSSRKHIRCDHFNENLHSCLRALQEGDFSEFHAKIEDSKQGLLFSIYNASEESTEYMYSTILKIQIFYHLGIAWDLRWKTSCETVHPHAQMQKSLSEPVIPNVDQLAKLNVDWSGILERSQLHMSFLEPFIAFRRVLLQILNCKDCTLEHLLESASTLRKGYRFSQAAAALHEFKSLCPGMGEEYSNLYWLGRLEEAKLLRAQGQHEMAINLAKYISEKYKLNKEASNVYRVVGKWLAETRSSNSRTILEKYLKYAVILAEEHKATDTKSIARRSQMHFHLAHYADALFRSYEERLNSSEWQAAMKLRKLKTNELEALIRRLRSSSKGDQTDYSVKIQELQKQLAMDREEAKKLQEDTDTFLSTALQGYEQCLVIGDKYDLRVVFRLVSLWFSLSSRQIDVECMLRTIKEVQSYKFIPLVYQIASRLGGSKDSQGPHSFQSALVYLIRKMAVEHPYHTIFQLLALANGDRIKDKQRSRNSFVVDMDKKSAAENILEQLTTYHRAVIIQMKQMVEIYIKLAELETKKEDTNKKVALPREIRSVRQLELVPVVTSNFPVDQSCQYNEGSFPHFKGLADSVMVMNGINAPKVVECLGSDGKKYRQLAKSGNDDLRQDAVMEQFFGLVNTFLQNHRDTLRRKLRIRTYKVVPFTPSAGVLEWVNGTLPLGEYLIGSARDGGAHGRYGIGDWTFLKCRQHMTTETDKRKAFQQVSENFRPVMHYFFLERFLHPADWFEKRLAYTRSVAASSMVGYIVGLGDRHSMNILIDQSTAEVVHIDLGVAFEQGLMLKTPERVPFRLTRDIVDGMGVAGVEGVFRRCCEETLSVMRTNKAALLTIVEVFIHDPLYKWALSPLKALQRQKETDDDLETSLEDSEDRYEGNKDAARALMRVKQKLDGYEEGEMRSVHGQVQQLIQDAIDPDRLCQMFPGWGAWL